MHAHQAHDHHLHHCHGAAPSPGMATDPVFGPVVACAAGGTATELLADTAVRLAPLTERDVHDMPTRHKFDRLAKRFSALAAEIKNFITPEK